MCKTGPYRSGKRCTCGAEVSTAVPYAGDMGSSPSAWCALLATSIRNVHIPQKQSNPMIQSSLWFGLLLH